MLNSVSQNDPYEMGQKFIESGAFAFRINELRKNPESSFCWGHTCEKHVCKKDEYLISRIMTKGNEKAATTFDIGISEVAEIVCHRLLEDTEEADEDRAVIASWLFNERVTNEIRLVIFAGKVIGHGFRKERGYLWQENVIPCQEIQVVFQKSRDNQLYVKTAYPVFDGMGISD